MRKLPFVLLLVVFGPDLWATQMITATASRSQLYRGESFTVYLTITPPEGIKDLIIEAEGPGFTITPPKNIPSDLAPGSSYTAPFEVMPPKNTHATTEQYSVVFNMRYHHAHPSDKDQNIFSEKEAFMWQSVELPFTITFNRPQFIFYAVIGLFIGWSIKALSTFSGVVLSSVPKPAEVRRGISILLAFFTRREITSALTSLAMGFLALLLLSRHEIPTGAVHDTLALGMGIGFLSDDQLLNRIKVVGGTSELVAKSI